jgi:PPP family 3-phenylpropionic acid transporter
MTARGPLRPFAVVWFCYFAAIGLFLLYAPLWFKELGLSTLAIGAIASIQAWTRVIAPYGWGAWADHTGQRVRVLRFAGWGGAVAALALALSGHLGTAAAVACVAVLFLCNGAVMPLTEAALSHHLRTAEGIDGASYGRTRVWGSIGFVLSVLVFGALLQRTGLSWFPWAVFVAFGLLALALLRIDAASETTSPAAAAPGALRVLGRPEVAWFYASVFFVVLGHTSLYSFFSLYLNSLRYSESAIGAFWALGVVVEIVFFWTQGRWFRILSPHSWLLLAALVAALRFAVMAAYGQVLALLVLAQMTHAITFAAHHATCIALLARYFPGRLRGRGQALYSMLGYGISGVVGGVAGGALIQRLGYPSLYWAACASALLGAYCSVRSRRAAPGFNDRPRPEVSATADTVN